MYQVVLVALDYYQLQHLGMLLKQVLTKLEQIAPLALAESWDNVGLLVEPHQARDVTKVLTTIDLTEVGIRRRETFFKTDQISMCSY